MPIVGPLLAGASHPIGKLQFVGEHSLDVQSCRAMSVHGKLQPAARASRVTYEQTRCRSGSVIDDALK